MDETIESISNHLFHFWYRLGIRPYC